MKSARKVFAGNDMSRTAMVFRIATAAGHRLTVPEMNRIKEINPRALERVYDTVLGGVIDILTRLKPRDSWVLTPPHSHLSRLPRLTRTPQ